MCKRLNLTNYYQSKELECYQSIDNGVDDFGMALSELEVTELLHKASYYNVMAAQIEIDKKDGVLID